MELREGNVLTNGVRLHVVEAGPENGDLVVLLHGFPEFSFGWRAQIGPLAGAGYRVVVPDQRGYNLSDKPRGLAAYCLDELVADIAGLIEATGRRQAFVVAHDWGGAAAWWLAVTRSELVRALAVINAPHPVVLRRLLRTSPAQRRKSRYMLYFQLPWLPERRLAGDDFAYMAAALAKTSRPGTFTADDLDSYREAWARPGALTAMLNWYRAALRRPPKRPPTVRVIAPTLLIWGARDRFLGQELVAPSLGLCDRGRAEILPDATHWVQHEEPGRVNTLLLDFFASTATGPAAT
jgi:epoxide hydrolase 4